VSNEFAYNPCMHRTALLLAIFLIFTATAVAALFHIPISSPFLPTGASRSQTQRASSSSTMALFPGFDKQKGVSYPAENMSSDEKARATDDLSTSNEESANGVKETPATDQPSQLQEFPTETERTSPSIQPESDGGSTTATHIESPYAFERLPFETINTHAREALVNIFCTTSHGSLSPASGSGVIITSTGIILTNAHVGQYVLLSESASVDLSCLIRMGAPATARYEARILYIPPVWIEEHASDIALEEPQGTGENDWALLAITNTVDNSPLPLSFPFIHTDSREELFSVGDPVLAAGYPAGFLGGAIATLNLHPTSVIAPIQKLFTFRADTIDLISLGGVILAQGGSSGGAVINGWDRLVGIIATASEGDATEERDVRAITIAHIDRSARENAETDLATLLSGNPSLGAEQFSQTTAPALIKMLLDELSL